MLLFLVLAGIASFALFSFYFLASAPTPHTALVLVGLAIGLFVISIVAAWWNPRISVLMLGGAIGTILGMLALGLLVKVIKSLLRENQNCCTSR